jgi:hypothetical protein
VKSMMTRSDGKKEKILLDEDEDEEGEAEDLEDEIDLENEKPAKKSKKSAPGKKKTVDEAREKKKTAAKELAKNEDIGPIPVENPSNRIAAVENSAFLLSDHEMFWKAEETNAHQLFVIVRKSPQMSVTVKKHGRNSVEIVLTNKLEDLEVKLLGKSYNLPETFVSSWCQPCMKKYMFYSSRDLAEGGKRVLETPTLEGYQFPLVKDY